MRCGDAAVGALNEWGLLRWTISVFDCVKLTKTAIFAALTAMLGSTNAAAQQYPAKAVRIIVPYAPGGGVDIMARIAAQKFGERMGVQFVVDNRGGGGTVIGTEIVARAPADGYTLLFANPGLTSSPALNAKLPFDPVQSFAPVGLYASSFNVLIVHPSVPVKSLKEIIALAKARPKQLNYASAGSGSATHLAMELFRRMKRGQRRISQRQKQIDQFRGMRPPFSRCPSTTHAKPQ